jgi:hypothetical protein
MLQKELSDGIANGIRPDPKKKELIKLCGTTKAMLE